MRRWKNCRVRILKDRLRDEGQGMGSKGKIGTRRVDDRDICGSPFETRRLAELAGMNGDR